MFNLLLFPAVGSMDLFRLKQGVNKLYGQIGGNGPEEEIDCRRNDTNDHPMRIHNFSGEVAIWRSPTPTG
jgi:hypothetical protein